MVGYILLASFFGFLIFLIHLISTREKRLRKKWKLIAEGEYQTVTQKEAKFNIVHGAFGRKSHGVPMLFSTIYFKAGQTTAVLGSHQFPPPGTYIRVYKNPLPEFKIEVGESRA